MVIHGEGIHFGGHVPIIDEVSRGTNFYMVELFNATGDDLATQPLISSMYKMMVQDDCHSDATEWIRSRFCIGKEFPGNCRAYLGSLQKSKVWFGVLPH